MTRKKIGETIALYQRGLLSKPEFIDSMYMEHHAALYDYASYLAETNIRQIAISDGQVVMTTRDRGLKFHCVPGDFRISPIETLNFADYERDEMAIMENLLERDGVFLDIGANIGWYSINLAASRRAAHIHAFEPLSETFNQLRKNVALNGLGNITIHHFGLSDQAREADFFHYPECSGNASSVNVSERDDVQIERCRLRTLDDFLAEVQTPVDFIKCDVEGAELFVFKGGKSSIARDLPIVFSEVLRKWSAKFNYDPNEIFRLFFGLGYRAFVVDGSGLREFKEMNDSTLHTNFFFLHSDKHAPSIARFCVSA